MGVTRLLTVLLPFRVIRTMVGEQRTPQTTDPVSGPVPPPVDAREESRARRIRWTVQRAAARTPWRSDCYPQALAARFLLRAARVPHCVTFGVRRDDRGELRAHAWVMAGPVTVTGGSGRTWVGVGTFTWSPRRP